MKVFLLSFLAIIFAQTPIYLNEIEQQLISSQDIKISKNLHLEGWYDDFTTAQIEALETDKPILLAFLGPAWCKWSDKFEEEVLTDSAFITEAKKELILVKVDLPEDFATAKLASTELMKRYNVDQCPSLLLIEPSGSEIASIDYLPLQSQEYAAHIKEMLGDFQKIAKVTKKRQIKKLDPIEIKNLYGKAAKFADKHFRKVLLEIGIKKDETAYFLTERYSEIVAKKGFKNREIRKLRKQILKRDPENTQGSQYKMAIMDFAALSEVIQTPQKPESVVKPLVEYLQVFGGDDKEHAWKVEMMISEYLFGKDCIKDALNHAKACLKIAPDLEKNEIEKSIQYLQTKLPAS